jgi:hypothetical protein
MSDSENTAYPVPPASFGVLISTIATQAMLSMGRVPNPVTNKTQTNLEMAKHFIDTLAILQEKTKGNLTKEEDGMLEAVLHELRMEFVAVTKK